MPNEVSTFKSVPCGMPQNKEQKEKLLERSKTIQTGELKFK